VAVKVSNLKFEAKGLMFAVSVSVFVLSGEVKTGWR
jgi:hypothetical protein